MSNPLFQMLGNVMPNGVGNLGNIIQQFQQFKQGFHGDPRQQVQQLLNSGSAVMDELMTTIQVMNERLYNGVMRKLQ